MAQITLTGQTDFGFYNTYVYKAAGAELITALKENWNEANHLFSHMSEEQLLHRYAPGKWSIKEIVQHLTDAERNFCYRAMRISRGDQAPLPMYDIHTFTTNAHAEARDIKNMLQELHAARLSTIAFFDGMHPSMLELTGPARDAIVSVKALGFALVGHCMHHIEIIKNKYALLGNASINN